MAEVEVIWRARITQGEGDMTRLVRSRIRTAFQGMSIDHFKVIVLGISPNGKPHAIVRKASVDQQEGVPMNIWVQGGQGLDCIVMTEEAKLPLLMAHVQSLSLPQKKVHRAQENKKKPKKPKVPKPVEHTIRLKQSQRTPMRRPPKGVTVTVKKASPVTPPRPIDRLSVIESSGITRTRSILSLPLRANQ